MKELGSKQKVRMKRSESEIRDEHLEDGAILIKFVPHKNASKEAIKKWRHIEKYGLKITKDGCWIPYKNFWDNKGGDNGRDRAYSYSLPFFENVQTDKKDDGKVNKHGWPIDQQYSHLCHYNKCCSPNHLVVETRWQNLKRNFCGKHDKCNCGNQQKCLRTYHNEDWDWDFEFYTYGKNLNTELENLLDLEFKILPKDYYHNEDLKRKNRNERNKRNKKQKKE